MPEKNQQHREKMALVKPRGSTYARATAYPTKDSHVGEQSCEEVKGNLEEKLQPRGRYGVISLFDGVSSVVPLLKKKIGYAPVVVYSCRE